MALVMNPFAIIICILFFCAAVWDAWKGNGIAALYWFFAGAINLTVMFMK